MEHAVFGATVIASRNEQDEKALSSPDLRRIPSAYQGECLITTGEATPPAQEMILGTEPVTTVQQELEARGQQRLEV